jgi:hypothetical protein
MNSNEEQRHATLILTDAAPIISEIRWDKQTKLAITMHDS